MKIETMQKLGGLSLISGSMLLTVYSVLFVTLLPYQAIRQDITLGVIASGWIPAAGFAFFGILLMIFGFMAVYSKIHKDSGVVGFLGFLFIEIAYMLQLSKVTWEICLYPVIAGSETSISLLREYILQDSPLVRTFGICSRATIFIGIILFCLALFRSKEFPKAGGVLIFAGAVIYGFGPLLAVQMAISGIIILSAGCFIIGSGMIRGKQV